MNSPPIHETMLKYFCDESVTFEEVVEYVQSRCIGSISLILFRKLTIMRASSIRTCAQLNTVRFYKMLRDFNSRRRSLLLAAYDYNTASSTKLKKIFACCELALCVREQDLYKGGECDITSEALHEKNGIHLLFEYSGGRVQSCVVSMRFRDLLKSWFLVRHIDKHMTLTMDWLLNAFLLKRDISYKEAYNMTDDVLVVRAYEQFRNAWMFLRSYCGL